MNVVNNPSHSRFLHSLVAAQITQSASENLIGLILIGNQIGHFLVPWFFQRNLFHPPKN